MVAVYLIACQKKQSHVWKYTGCYHALRQEVGDMITDHHLLLCNVHSPKPHFQKSKIITRALPSIDLPSFRRHLAQELGDLDLYDTQLTNVLDKHAPLKEKSIVIRLHQPWFSDDLNPAKSGKRKAERLWRRIGLTVHCEIFKEEKGQIKQAPCK